MIDTSNETLISIAEVPANVPTRPHIATVWRWIQRGIRGVNLETALIGGRRFTSQEALQRFFERSNASTKGTHARPAQSGRSKARQAAIEAAERELIGGKC